MAINGYITNLRNGRFSPDFYAAVGAGLVSGMTRAAVLGHATNLTTATVYDLYENASSVPLYPWLTSASTLQVSSSSANDTAAGSGTRTVRIIGLDANYSSVTEVVTMNGVTPVVTANSFLRVNTFVAVAPSASPTATNAGDITLQKSGGGNILAIMRVGSNFGNSANFTVPAGSTALVNSLGFSVTGAVAAKAGEVALAHNGTGAMVVGARFSIGSGIPYQHEISEGVFLPQRTDVIVRIPSVGQAATDFSGGFQMLIIDNSYFT